MMEHSTDEKSLNSNSKTWKRFLLNRWLLITVAIVAIYSLTGFFLLPWIVSRYASKFTAEKLNRKSSVAEVHVNPFLLKFEAIGFKFEEADGRSIVGFDRLFIDFELSSLFKWAWTFADIQIEKPYIYIEIGKDGRLNFQKILETLPKSEDPPPPATNNAVPRLIIQHAAMTNGTFCFVDQSVSTPVTKTFESMNLEFKDISTLPEREGPYLIQAALPDGGTIAWQGEISLQPIFSEGEISVSGFKVATAWEFARDQLNIDRPTGEIDFSTRYRFDYKDNLAELILQNMQLSLNGFSITKRGEDEPLLSLSAINVDDTSFDLQKRKLVIPKISLQKGEISASINKKGLLNWQDLTVEANSKGSASSDEKASAPDNQPWILKITGISLVDLSLDFKDHSRVRPLAMSVGKLKLSLTATAEIGAGPPKGVLDGIKVDLNGIALAEIGKESPVFSLDSIVLDDSTVDVNARSIILSRITAKGGETNILRSKDGKFPLMEFLATKKPQISDPGQNSPDTTAKSESKNWLFSLGAFELDNHNVSSKIEDFSPPILYELKDIHTDVTSITNDGKTPINFEAAFNVGQGGSAAFNGHLSQSADDIAADIKIANISLTPLRPLLNEFTYLTLDSGNVSASSKLSYKRKEAGPQILADGSIKINRLKINEVDTGERFLEWKEMSANNINLSLSPDKLQIKEVKLAEPGAKIMIYKDRSVNLAKIMKPSDKSTHQTTTQSEGVPAEKPEKKQSEFPVNIGKISIKNGVVDFSDFSLVLPFVTHVTQFTGMASGISSDPASQASLKFEGKVGNFGSTSVDGALKPFAPKAFMDISVLFNNVEMLPLSPYSATFAGRKIASGTLNLNLEYKIENSELLGENSVILEDFTLGERVEAPGAINLPLDLAVALLKDAQGKIDVALPVRGNVDNPEFKYGAVIRKAIIKLIKKIVTSPFKALGSLFGGKEEQIDAISFTPGKAALQSSELKKLQKVADALKQRPQLKLVVRGGFDSQIDGGAIRKVRVNRAVVEQMEETQLPPDEEPDMISFDNAKTQRALEKRLETVGGEKAFDDFKTRYEKQTGRKPEPVKPYLAIFGKGSSDIEFYQALFEELVRLEPLGETDLVDLGNRRSEEIVKTLTAAKGLDSTRVEAGNSEPAEKASPESVNTTLTLDVMQSSG